MDSLQENIVFDLKPHKYEEQDFIGIAHIFSNSTFSSLEFRHGNDCDVKALENTLPKLGFKTETHEDFKEEECRQKLKAIASLNGKDYFCLLFIFLSYGSNGQVLMSDNYGIEIKSILSYFIKTEICLKDKPKLFLFQACHRDHSSQDFDIISLNNEKVGNGGATTEPLEEANTEISTASSDDIIEETESLDFYLPIGANIFTGFASSPGFVSYRLKSKGSLYIQKFTEIINKFVDSEEEKLDFLSVMTKVAGEVSQASGKLSKDPKKPKKQMPLFSSTLTKNLELGKYRNRSSDTNPTKGFIDDEKSNEIQKQKQ